MDGICMESYKDGRMDNWLILKGKCPKGHLKESTASGWVASEPNTWDDYHCGTSQTQRLCFYGGLLLKIQNSDLVNRRKWTNDPAEAGECLNDIQEREPRKRVGSLRWASSVLSSAVHLGQLVFQNTFIHSVRGALAGLQSCQPSTRLWYGYFICQSLFFRLLFAQFLGLWFGESRFLVELFLFWLDLIGWRS